MGGWGMGGKSVLVLKEGAGKVAFVCCVHACSCACGPVVQACIPGCHVRNARAMARQANDTM